MEKSNYLTEFQSNLEKLEMGELRSKASKVFGLKLTREHTKKDIIDLIISVMSKGNYAEQAEGELRPGYARIKLNRTEGRSNLVYFNCNGYFGWIPVEQEVDVPIKVLSVLDDAKEMKKVLNEFDEYHDVLASSYPYQLLGKVDGPDPKPGREAQTERKWQAYKEFYAREGFWPSQKVLQAARNAGAAFNSLKQQLSDSEESE
jgi:hypothetical protein